MKSDDQFPPEIAAAFRDYPQIGASPEFDSQIWARLDEKSKQYRGFRGLCRRVWELEIEGVAVWRLVGSTVSGGLFSLLVLGLGYWLTKPTTPAAPLPQNPPTMAMAGPLYARQWRNFQPPPRVFVPAKREERGEVSCAGFSGRWA